MRIKAREIAEFSGNMLDFFNYFSADSLDKLLSIGPGRYDVGDDGCSDSIKLDFGRKNKAVKISYNSSQYVIGKPLRVDIKKDGGGCARFNIIAAEQIFGYENLGCHDYFGNRIWKKTILGQEWGKIIDELESLNEKEPFRKDEHLLRAS